MGTLRGIAATALAALTLLSAGTGTALSHADRPEHDEAILGEAARLRALALAEMEDGDYEEALPLLERLAAILPDNILPPINLAISLYQLQRPEDAARQIERARGLDGDNPRMLFVLARILEAQGLEEETTEVLEHFSDRHPTDPRPDYLAALAASRHGNPAAAVENLTEALDRSPENLVLMVDLLVAAAEAGDEIALEDCVDAIEDRLNGFDEQQERYAELIRDRIDEGDVAATRPPATVLRNLLRPTELYQIYRVPLTGGRQSREPMFPQLDFDPPLPKSVQGGQDIALAFVDASDTPGFTPTGGGRSAVVLRTPGREPIVELGDGAVTISETDGSFDSRRLPIEPAALGPMAAYDLDQDTHPDLLVADGELGLILYPGTADGAFGPGVTVHPPATLGVVRRLLPADLDHDGDLDVLLLRDGASDLYLQNNGDGTWEERGGELGLAGPASDTVAAVLADFDDDGDLDLVTARPDQGLRLLLNPIVGPFEDGSEATGLSRLEVVPDGLVAADFDNDGSFDLVAWDGRGAWLLRNARNGFEPSALPGRPESGSPWEAVEVADLDNDGDRDLAVIDDGGRLTVLRNRRESWSAEPTDLAAAGIETVAAVDQDADGDIDLRLGLADGGRRFWRNDGGNRNQWIRLSLRGKNDNNSKNNTQGLFTRIETRAGGAYQAVLGNGGVNHLGLGARRQAEILRVVWTNGVAQIWQQVGARRTLIEEQVLKGSCPFLYTWNGDEFRFHTDLMWRSPLGMFMADGSRGTAASASDWVLIPGEHLRPEAGELWLQVTEELWETIYIDRQYLLVVDHPSSAQLVVDERFGPGVRPLEPPLHWIDDVRPPVAATDQADRDVLGAIAERDGVRVAALPLDRYQGLTRGHHLDLDFTDLPTDERLRLLLWGWIFPTDSSINFALEQDSGRAPYGPRLERQTADGRWEVLDESIGMPSGKRKAVVVELPADLGPRARLRISSNLQIYWDAARIAVGSPPVDAVVTRLAPIDADLHYRGFSREYRASSDGPHLFDYASTTVASPFRGMTGRATRYGPVGSLLERSDSLSVVMSAGDEMTLRFATSALPELPEGWRRDYVLYSDGWVKDADLHTLAGRQVGPLPYHGMTDYPERPHAFPSDRAAREYLRTYQTRQVTDEPFRSLLRNRR